MSQKCYIDTFVCLIVIPSRIVENITYVIPDFTFFSIFPKDFT
jgi:hypothetical protein